MRNFLLAMALLSTSTSFGAAQRAVTADTIQNTTGGATLAVPATGGNIVSDTAAQTLTNKTLTAPVVSAPTGIVKGDVGLGNVDNTSDATKNAATATLTNKTISGATNTFSNIPAGTALTGQLPIANGGTGASTQAGAANAILPSQTAASGQFLTSNGTNVSWATIPAAAANVVGSTGSPTAITAAGGVPFTGTADTTVNFITGSGGAVSVTASPQIAAGTVVGQRLLLIGRSATNTVTLSDGSGLSLNGAWVAGLQSVMTLVWDGSVWVEASRR